MNSTAQRRVGGIATGAIAMVSLTLSGTASFSAEGEPAARSERRLGQYSGYEGNEAALGSALVAALKAASPPAASTATAFNNRYAAAKGVDPRYDFTGRERMLGLAMTQVIRTLNHNQSYQHEVNDALVKLTLDHIMFAKRNRLLEAMVTEDVNSQRQQLERVKRLIDRTGNKDLAIVAIFEQTACFFQLVDHTQRSAGQVTYKSPYGPVLEQTVRMGIHQLTEEEIHNVWTIPRMRAYAQILGVALEISPWRADGMISVRLAAS